MRLFVSILLSMVCLASFAQVSFGVKAGANFNEITEIDNWYVGDPKANVNFHLGVLAEINLARNFSLIPELQFSRRGDTFGESRYNLNYLDLPAYFSYSIEKLSFHFGASAGYLVSAGASSQGSHTDVSSTFDKKIDVGLLAGAQYQITERISVVARYYVGLTPVLEMRLRDEFNNTLGRVTAYNRTAQISIAYKISGIED